MKVLIIGQGGREHALVKALRKSPTISEIHVIPGNDGMAKEALCHSLDINAQNLESVEKLIQFCLRTEITYVVIGPEDPLVFGLSDRLRERGILVFGPSQEAAQLEGSKIFAKQFMNEAGVATSPFSVVNSVQEALDAATNFTAPYVLKADGLAAGKGVFICPDLADLKEKASLLFEKKIFGTAGDRALLEQFMPGWELSYLILTNGSQYQSLPLAQDHKKLLDENKGPNTGGMGTVAPLHISDSLEQQIRTRIIEPTLKQLDHTQYLYRGVIFLGLMITPKGPQLLEYNVRFGDPETQVILPLLDEDVGQLFYNIAIGKLPPARRNKLFATCVVGAAKNYPESPTKGDEIQGDIHHQTSSSYIISSGVKKTETQKFVTNGGRVLGFVGLGSSLEESQQNAYLICDSIQWSGKQFRQDIGKYL